MTNFSQKYLYNTTRNSLIVLILLISFLPVMSQAAINIVNVETEFEEEDIVKITWQTDVNTSGKVYYGEDKDNLLSFIVDKNIASKNHEIKIGNLGSDTKYYFQVFAISGSETVESFIYDFETEEFTDTKAPHVTEQKLAWLSGTAASFTWLTDEKADGVVEYGLDKTYRFRKGGARDVTEHTVTLRNLKTGTRYFARLGSKDRDNNFSGYFHFEFKTLVDDKIDKEDLIITNLRPSGPSDTQIGATNLIVSLTTNHLAKGRVILRGPGVGLIGQEFGYNLNHSAKFTGLSRQSKYEISILMDDVFGKKETKAFAITTKKDDPISSGVGINDTGSTITFNSAATPKTTLTCTSAIYDGLGYYGQYFNQTEDLRFPLNMEARETGFFDLSKHELTQIDPRLNFGRSFNGLGVRSNGSPFTFSGYWRGLVAVPRSTEYSYSMVADDNAWVYINGQLDSSLNGKQLKLSPERRVFLQRGLHTLEIYFSFRGRTGSEFTLNFDETARVFPLPVGCSAEAASQLIPGNNFDALFSITKPHPQSVGVGTGTGVDTGTGSGGVGIGNGQGGGVVIGNGDSVDVLGDAFSLYTPAAALYRIAGTPDIYALMNGQLHYISSPASFREYGFDWAEVETVGVEIFQKYPRARLIKGPDGDTIYFLYQRPENQWLKINLNSPTVFVSYPDNYWGNVITVTEMDVDSYPDVELIKSQDSNAVYFLEADTKRPITANVFNARGFNPHEIAEVNQIQLDSYLTGGELK